MLGNPFDVLIWGVGVTVEDEYSHFKQTVDDDDVTNWSLLQFILRHNSSQLNLHKSIQNIWQENPDTVETWDTETDDLLPLLLPTAPCKGRLNLLSKPSWHLSSFCQVASCDSRDVYIELKYLFIHTFIMSGLTNCLNIVVQDDTNRHSISFSQKNSVLQCWKTRKTIIYLNT